MAGGRPSKYHSNVEPKLLLIEAWCRDGLTVEDIAANLEVSAASMYEYQKKYPELLEALKRNREFADAIVENSLYKRALGYEFDEITHEPLYNMLGDPILNPDGTPKVAVTKIVRKQVVPDTTAQIFWLKNRKPQQWRDKQELGIEGELNIKVSLPKGLTPDADN
jgi:hypothetical protein